MSSNSHVYSKEEKILVDAKEFLSKNNHSLEEYRTTMSALVSAYGEMLGEIRLITRVSDRLQHKLSGHNDLLLEQKQELEDAKKIMLSKNKDLKAAKTYLESKVFERTQELERINHELLVVNEELDKFVYRAAHDLKGPLARISGMSMLAQKEEVNDLAKSYFASIEVLAKDMNQILEKLQMLNELKYRKIDKEKLNPETLLKELTTKLEKSFKMNGKAFLLEYPQGMELYTDKTLFSVFIENLLTFGLLNTAPNNTEPNTIGLKLSPKMTDNSLLVHLRYRGEVIPGKMSEEIFELFHRTTNTIGHSGMELYTAKQAIGRLNGNLELMGSNNKETFFVALFKDILFDDTPKSQSV